MTKEKVIHIKGDTKDFDKKLDQMSAKMKQAGQQMQNIGRSLSKYVTLPLVAAGTASFMAAKDFEASMSKITGLVGVASDQVEKWKDDLLRLGPELGKTPTELADALFFVTSAGLRGAAALDVLKMSAKASVAGLGETKTVADLVTSAMNAYGQENLSAAEATDILVAAVREGKAEATELAGSMGQVLPVAAEMGVTFSDVGAAMAAMTRTGTNAATAATQLRAIMVSLLKPTDQANNALEMMGTSATDLRKKIREEGLMSALGDIRRLTNQYGEDVMANVFPNIRALAGVLDLMGANASENVKIFESLQDSTGALDAAFEEASNTAQFKWDQAMASANSTLITIGDTVKIAVIPLLERFTKTMESLSSWFRSLSDEQRKNVVRWGAIAAAAGPVLTMLGMFVKTVLPALITGLKALRVAALGPVGVAIAGVYGIWKLWNFEQEKTKRLAGELASKTLPELERMAKETSGKLTKVLEEAGAGTGIALASGMAGTQNPFVRLIDQARKALGGDVQTEQLIQQMQAIQQATDMVKERQAEEAKVTQEIEAQVSAMMNMADMPTGEGMAGPINRAAEALHDFSNITEKSDLAILNALDGTSKFRQEFIDIPDAVDDASKSIKEVKEEMDNFAIVMQSGLANVTADFAAMVGSVMAGSGTMKGAFTGVLDTLLDILSQLGQLAIATGIAISGIKKALQTLNPVVAITAGVALIGLTSFAKNKLSNLGESIPGFATGGVVPPGYPNDSYLARLTSGERIIPAGQTAQSGGTLTARIAGQDLLFVLEQAGAQYNNNY